MKGRWFKKIRRVSPDYPARLAMVPLRNDEITDGTTNRNGAAIPSPNPGHNRDRNVGRSSDGPRSVDGAPTGSAPSVDARVTRGCRRSSNAPGADDP